MHKFVVICLLIIPFTGFGQARRALSLIEKQKYESAFDLLSNGLAKDTTSASIPFVLANLYLVQEWPRNQLDSAFYFSVQSLHKYDVLDEKHLDKHIKEGFGKTRLLTLKKHIDSLSFLVAKQGGTECDYQLFIDTHTDANELDSAVFLRNEQAYITAEGENTLSSYKQFLDTYPDAEDWSKADAHYQKILYRESTASGKLKAYKTFVEAYPSSPYLEEAITKIYNIEVGRNTVKSILDFVTVYPNSKASVKAIGLLYHKHLVQEKACSFADKYPKIKISDSLKFIINSQEKTVLPIWNDQYFQMIDLEENLITDSLTWIDARLPDGQGKTIYSDFTAAKIGSNYVLLGKNGDAFYGVNNFEFIKEKQGFVFLKTISSVVIVHKNGDVVVEANDANVVGQFIGFKKKNLWGLQSVTGLKILEARYDSIWVEQELIFLTKGDYFFVATPNSLYPALDNKPVKLNTSFDDYEWLTDELLWVEQDGKEGLLSATLEELVPMGKHQIDLAGKGWTATNKGEINVPEFSESTLTKFAENENWQIGSIKDSLIIKYKYNQTFSPTSAVLLGPSAIIMHWADSGFVYLTDTTKFYKPVTSEVKPLLNQNNKVFYYEVIEGDSKVLMNGLGEKIDVPNYNKAIALNASFFQLETRKTKQLYSSEGSLLLDKIDGASLINDSTISILKEQKFGMYQPFDSVYIEPLYSRKLIPLADSLWIATSDGKQGLISSVGDTLLPFNFNEMHYWINGLLFAKNNLAWSIFDIKSSKFLESGIVSYSSITRNGSPKIRFQKGVGLGVFDSDKGTVLKPTYSNVYLEGTTVEPYYRAEKYVEEAGLHIMLYYNIDGEQLFQNILDESAYSSLYGSSEE